MKGKFNYPGGKTVQVQTDVVAEKFSNVRLSGDFFQDLGLEPQEVAIHLDGLSTELSAKQLGSHLAECIFPNEADHVDLQPIAVALRRAITEASDWSDHVFDVIPAQMFPVSVHVALDEVLAVEVGAGLRRPVFRFWDWPDPAVVIGSYQSVRNEIDPTGQKNHAIHLVRRSSGGGAMFMEPGKCVTYSLIVPPSLVAGLSFEQSYAFLDDWVLGALNEIGVKARYVPLNDIASEKGKIAGAAQRRFVDGTVLHHVTMAYDIDSEKMLEVLRIGREKLSEKGTKSANKKVDPLLSQTTLTRQEIMDAFLHFFKARYNCVDSCYTEEELTAAEELVVTKFDTDKWRYRVP